MSEDQLLRQGYRVAVEPKLHSWIHGDRACTASSRLGSASFKYSARPLEKTAEAQKELARVKQLHEKDEEELARKMAGQKPN